MYQLKQIFCVILGLVFPVAYSSAGTLKGTVKAEVSHEDSSSGGSNAYGSRRYKFLETVDYSQFQDFVISIEGIPYQPEEKPPTEEIEQINGVFVPAILPIVKGTEVSFPNRDSIFHNVFSMSDSKQFDLGYYKKEDDAKVVVFEKPGRVDVFCSIHSQMHCVVIVLDNPWFTMTDRKGRFEFEDLPAGKYRLKAWHQRLPSKYIEIEVADEGTIDLEITMGLADLPKY